MFFYDCKVLRNAMDQIIVYSSHNEFQKSGQKVSSLLSKFIMKTKIKLQKILLQGIVSLLLISGCNFSEEQKNHYLLSPPHSSETQEHQATNSRSLQENRIQTFTITAPQLGNRERKIQVYLPPNYESSLINYPVIYLHDGGALFDPPPKTVGDWRIDETLDALYDKGLTQGVIAVGIEFDRENLWSEYSPWVNENMHDWVKTKDSKSVEGGDGDAFLSFIIDTLKPAVDARYRTLPGREHTMIGGSCRNALIPLYAGLTRSDVFSKVMVMSPAVWLAENGGVWLSDNQLIDFIRNTEVPSDVRVYIDIGTAEESGPQPNVFDRDGKQITYPQAYVEGAEQVYLTLLSQGFPEENLRFEIITGAKGIRDEWAKRFDEALLWLIQ